MVLALGLVLGAYTNLAAQDTHAHNWGKSKDVKAQAHIEMGDELLGSQEYVRARGEYENAVEILRARDEFASPALYRIAASYYYEGKPQTAASRFDQLAEEAALYGDVVTEVWALADAAWIYGQAGNKLGVQERVERMNKLLKSPYLPDSELELLATKRLGEINTLTESGTR
jgi:tetratricopeptide (TPR) repeat protein